MEITTTKKHGEEIWPSAEQEIVRSIIDYSEMKSNKNAIIERTIVDMIAESEDWPTSIALPLSESEEININWKKWIFTPKRLDPVPEEGVSEKLSSRMKSRSDALIRYGIAFEQELGFQETPEGSRELMGYLKSMSASIRETLGYDVITTLLNTPNYSLEWRKQMGIASKYTSVKQMMEEDVMGFGIFAKYDRGFEDILGKTTGSMKNWSVTPNLIITAGGSKHTLAFRKSQTNFGTSGPCSTDCIQLGSKYYKEAQGCVMVESRSFHVENGKEPEDPMIHEKQVGEFYEMRDFYANDPGHEYKSRQCDIGIYDEERDDFVRITLKQALQNCERFHPDGRLRTEELEEICKVLNGDDDADLDNEVLEEELRRLSTVDGFEADPFICRKGNKYSVCKTIKNMESLKNGKNEDVRSNLGKKKSVNNNNTEENDDRPVVPLESSVDRNVFEDLINSDVPLPFKFLLFRPHITHRMGSMVVMTRGTSTGGTFIHKKDFRAGYDHQTKTMSAHFTFWAKPIVLVEENVQVARDVTFHGYVSGGNTKFINNQSTKKTDASLYCILTSLDDDVQNPLDLSGTWNRNYIRNVSDNSNNKFHYESAPYYSMIWKWKQSFCTKPYGEEDYLESICNENTICFQGFQYIWRPTGPSGMGDYKRCIKNTGHLGDTYRGVKAVRMGYRSSMEEQTYEDVLTI